MGAAKKARKVALIGVPGSGKTTLAKALQVSVGSTEVVTQVCPEYAREFITKMGPPEHVATQSFILNKQLRRENMLGHGCDWLFCDSPVYFCYIYTLLFSDIRSNQQRKICKEMYRWAVLDCLERYDVVFFLPRQFETVDDGVRNPEMTEMLERAITGFVELHKQFWPNFVELRSEETDPKAILHDRVRIAKEALEELGPHVESNVPGTPGTNYDTPLFATA